MGDLAEVYDSTRRSFVDFLSQLSESEIQRPVPATPGWRVRDILSHLVGDAGCVVVGDFPRDFFSSFGDDAAVASLNQWTAGQVAERRDRSVEEVCSEWEDVSEVVLAMMRGEKAWPDGIPFFADRVMVTDLGVHQQDVFGAFGIERDRVSAPVKIGLAGYIATTDMRLRADGTGAIRFEAPDKSWTAGERAPQATVRASRFELFRALSGRRNPGQIRAYDWAGDPEPFIRYFYPYGVRSDALEE